jgi:hypothetical protein
MQSSSHLLSLGAAAIGIVYILAAAKLNTLQIQLLFACILFCALLANAIIPVYTAIVSGHARLQLDVMIKNKPLSSQVDVSDLQAQAWREVIKLPGNCALAELFTAYLLVVLPVVLFMRWVGSISNAQSVHIAIGGVFAGALVARSEERRVGKECTG